MNEQASATIQIPAEYNREARQIGCLIQRSDGKRLAIVAQERVVAFTPVTIQYDDAMFLGEVVACTQDVEHAWHIEIKIEQILTGLQSLMNLRANLLGEPVPAPLNMVPASVGR